MQPRTTPRNEPACPFCSGPTTSDAGRMALLLDDDVVVIEDVPARRCRNCMEEFYDEHILGKVERLRGERFASAPAKRTVRASVYAWEEL